MLCWDNCRRPPCQPLSPSPAVLAHQGRSENLSSGGLLFSYDNNPEHPGSNPATITAGEPEHDPPRDAAHT